MKNESPHHGHIDLKRHFLKIFGLIIPGALIPQKHTLGKRKYPLIPPIIMPNALP